MSMNAPPRDHTTAASHPRSAVASRTRRWRSTNSSRDTTFQGSAAARPGETVSVIGSSFQSALHDQISRIAAERRACVGAKFGALWACGGMTPKQLILVLALPIALVGALLGWSVHRAAARPSAFERAAAAARRADAHPFGTVVGSNPYARL